MNYHVSCSNIFASFYLMILLLQLTCGQDRIENKYSDFAEEQFVATGDLYELFKKRLEKFNKEMATTNDDMADKLDTSSVMCGKPSTASECLYDEYKKRLDRVLNELSLDNEMYDRSSRNGALKSDSKNQNQHDSIQTKAQNYAPKNQQANELINDSTSNILRDASNTQPELQTFKAHTQHNKNSKKIRHNNNKVTRATNENNYLIPAGQSPLYPSVLTKTYETETSPSIGIGSLFGAHPESILSAVGSQLNANQLDLAQKIAKITDLTSANIQNNPQMAQELHNYIPSTVNLNAHERPAKESPAANSIFPSWNTLPAQQFATQNSPGSSTLCGENLSQILEKVLSKLEEIKGDKSNNTQIDDDVQPNDAPCEIAGNWISYVMGLRFDIVQVSPTQKTRMRMSFDNNKMNIRRTNARVEDSEVLLKISPHETIPPKVHRLMNTSWKFTGRSMKQFGGPLFMTSFKRPEKVLATFAGFCRTCGGIDTIFGAWTLVHPSNDCQDITVCIETKRDILRRDDLDSKRKDRLKQISSHKKNPC